MSEKCGPLRFAKETLLTRFLAFRGEMNDSATRLVRKIRFRETKRASISLRYWITASGLKHRGCG